MDTVLTDNYSVTINDHPFPYCRRWRGLRLLPVNGYLAFDTETEVVDLKRQIPRLAIAAASAGELENYLIHPDDLGTFILAHRSLHFICHNSSFDFWVVENHLRQRGEDSARQAWWAIADQNRLHDSMLLDALVRLATDDSYPSPRDLAVVAKQYAGLEISKDDPYRQRYGEIIGADWQWIEDGFFAYAVKDAIVTRLAYLVLRQQGLKLVEEFGRYNSDIRDDARQKFGLLTEAVQVKKAIALAQITRNGMTVDLDAVRKTETELRSQLDKAVQSAQTTAAVYKVDADGVLVLSGKSRVPACDEKALRQQLGQIQEQIERETQASLRIPQTKRGLSRSVKVWSDYTSQHPFLEHWIKAQGLAKLLQFFSQYHDQVRLQDLARGLNVNPAELAGALSLKGNGDGATLVAIDEFEARIQRKARLLGQLGLAPDRAKHVLAALAESNRGKRCLVHPHYNILTRSGRTSCTSPNIQQIPKDSTFRQTFQAAPGTYLLIADYSYIELRTLAASTLQRYGWSKMADVIKAGIDPHVHTAAMMLGVPVEDFLSWKDNEAIVEKTLVDGKELVTRNKDRFDKARQAAKPVNFGVPGGLGVTSLVAYAHSTYRVELTPEQAKARRDQLTKEIYPELDLYLAEDGPLIIARNLQAPVQEVRNELGNTALSSIQKILAGDPKRQDGKPYQPTFVSRIWSSLNGLNRNPELTEALANRQPSTDLAARVCHAGVATLTGRIRGRVRYSQARNTPFQGLAADGAALALFELIKEGFQVIAFIHDEILTLLPDEGGHVCADKVQRVKEIMCQNMEQVLCGDIPADCEVALAERWTKKAKLIERDGNVYPWKA